MHEKTDHARAAAGPTAAAVGPSGDPFRVAVVGGGIAGVTAMMALAEFDDGRLAVELVDPGSDFVMSAQLIGAPWGGAPVRVALPALAAEFGAAHRRERVVAVRVRHGVLVTAEGGEHAYHAILVAAGARLEAPYPGVPTVGVDRLPDVLSRADRGDLAVLVPPGTGWTLPAYQLALLAAGSGPAAVRVVTGEHRPLALFGPAAGGPAADFLTWHGVQVDRGRWLPVGGDGAAQLADHVIALPVARPPGIAGLPADARGFVPVDATQRVRGQLALFAAGDAADGTVKQGGLAAHQAETAARAIARLAGLAPPFWTEPATVRGKLTAGEDVLYLRRDLADAQRDTAGDSPYWRADADPGTASFVPLWKPEAALVAWRLSRWLQRGRRGLGADPLGHVARPAR